MEQSGSASIRPYLRFDIHLCLLSDLLFPTCGIHFFDPIFLTSILRVTPVRPFLISAFSVISGLDIFISHQKLGRSCQSFGLSCRSLLSL